MVTKDKEYYHQKYNDECIVFNYRMRILSKEIVSANSRVYNLEIKFLRKVMREINLIRDVLGGATHIFTGLKVLPKSPETTPIVIRNSYETYVYWKYLSGNNEKEFYTNAYYYQESLDTSAVLYSDFDESYPLNKINMQDDGLQEAKAAWILQKKEFYQKKVSYPKWYSLRNGAKSFTHMNYLLHLEEPYEKIYGFCSKVSHGMGLTKELVKFEDENIHLKAIYHIDPVHEKYLWFLSWKLVSMINQDIYEFYKGIFEKKEKKDHD